MGFHKKLVDLDDIFEEIFKLFFRFGRKGKKVTKKGCKPIVGCIGIIFIGTLFISICGVMTLFTTNRVPLPNLEAITTFGSGEVAGTEPVQNVQEAAAPIETQVEPEPPSEPEIIIEETQATGEIAESTVDLRDAIYVELVEDSRIIDQIGDPFQLIESDLTAIVRPAGISVTRTATHI